MPTINECSEMVKRLELDKGFSRDLKNKIDRLQDETKEVLEEYNLQYQMTRFTNIDKEKLAEELIDCIFFIVSSLSIMEVDGDRIFMDKYIKNMKRTTGKGVDNFEG
jgi:NTP pyrophosphatase (non-canonical NTP hydrolase)